LRPTADRLLAAPSPWPRWNFGNLQRAPSRPPHLPFATTPNAPTATHTRRESPPRRRRPTPIGPHLSSIATRAPSLVRPADSRRLGMYSVHVHPAPTMSNGGIGNGIMDPSGTIDPSALNAAGTSAPPSVVARAVVAQTAQPRPRPIAGLRASYIRSARAPIDDANANSPLRCARRPTAVRRTATLARAQAQSLAREQLRRPAVRRRRYVHGSAAARSTTTNTRRRSKQKARTLAAPTAPRSPRRPRTAATRLPCRRRSSRRLRCPRARLHARPHPPNQPPPRRP
jgi:hypothetical protein